MTLSLEQFRQNFGVHPVPRFLEELLSFQNMANDWYSDSFELALISKDGLRTYFGDNEEALSQFLEFGHDGNGSTYALWLYTDLSLDDAPIVYLNSEAMGDTVVAENLLEFFTLLAWDKELILGSYSTIDEDTAQTKRNQEFRVWIREKYQLQAVSNPNATIQKAQKNHPGVGVRKSAGNQDHLHPSTDLHTLPTFLHEGGWELTLGGTHRDLYFATCYSFIPKKAGQQHISPVEVLVPREDRCGSCGRHLYTLFDINLEDPLLAFLALPGRRLRIAFCPTCTTLGESVYTDVDLNGSSQWSLSNGEEPVEPLEDINDWEDFPELPSKALILGSARSTPYKADKTYTQEGLSQFGGSPTWVHHAEYPCCPQCDQTMLFVGQLSSSDLVAESEGMFYAFFCAPCGKAATGFQST